MCVYIYVFVCAYIYMCVCVFAYIVCACVCVYTYVFVLCEYMHTYVHMCVSVRLCLLQKGWLRICKELSDDRTGKKTTYTVR